MQSNNEWTQLKKVIVGIADNAKIPKIDKSIRTVNYADNSDPSTIPVGSYPKKVIDETNEDLEIFCDNLKKEKIEVVRPDATNCEYYNYCPRDNVLIQNNLAIATPMPIRVRNSDWRSFQKHLDNNIIDINLEIDDSLYNLECVNNLEILALNETVPAFDAANVIRANNDLLYLVSNSGNRKGADLLQAILGDNIKVHKLENVYSYMHIDSTICFLREGLLLANPSRIKNKNQLPKPFCDWDIIYSPEMFDTGFYKNYNNASIWVGMNLLSINENLVVLEKNQHELRKKLEQYKIDCMMLPLRHQRTLGGGFHCVTLDLIRE
jgi:N-dimethylarginine dimethylaminohydrolase